MDIRQIKESTDIGRLIGRYISLQQKGCKLTGLCPFHDDHHPSLVVDTRKQTFTCYACGAYGDVFTFIQRIENCSFAEAAGRLSVKDLMRESENNPSRLKTFALFPYIPPHPELTDSYLLFEVGVSPVRVPDPWRKFSGRIIFPIRDDEGRLVGFAGRRMTDEDASVPKYVNSSAAEGFQKGSVLYGLYKAKESILRTGKVFVTEGYKDMLAMYAAGFTNTVALAGTVLTEGHQQLLQKYGAKEVHLLLDADKAGKEAAAKIASQLLTSPFGGRGALPEGDDPDSLFRRLGKEAFTAYIREKVPTAERMGRVVTDTLRYLYEGGVPDLQACLDCEEMLQRLIEGLCREISQTPPSSVSRTDKATVLSMRLEQYGYISKVLHRPGAV